MSHTLILSMQNFEPSHMTTVLPGLSRRRLPSSQSLTSAIHVCQWLVERHTLAWTRTSDSHQRTDVGRLCLAMAITSCNSVVNSTKSSGPRTDPCGTPYSTGKTIFTRFLIVLPTNAIFGKKISRTASEEVTI